jgi:membrane protein implicated in regulation of membrane protease activity
MLLAGPGVSMAMSVCAAVLLGASVGLSGLALAAFLGGITVAASAGARSRRRSGTATGRHRSRGG